MNISIENRLLVLLITLFIMTVSASMAVEISISCGAVGRELELCKSGVEAWAAKSGNRVRVVSTPNSSNERLALYQQLLASKSPDIDIFQIDIVWPGMLASHLADLSSFVSEDIKNQHFRRIIDTVTVKGRLVAIPWFTDAGILYFRSDLLEEYDLSAPETWADHERSAKAVQEQERKKGNKKFWGFVWQGRAYEGLTCNALEWIDSHGGGEIVDSDGTVTINNSGALLALKRAAKWIDNISPPGVLNYTEEEARALFQSGNALFMRNWPYAWALAQSESSPIKGKVGITRLPLGSEKGKHSAALGGWQLAVSRYSLHKEQAVDLALFLTDIKEQKRRAMTGTYNPTIPSLYSDPEILEANPFFHDLYKTMKDAAPRPTGVTGSKYNRVSSEFRNSVHSVLGIIIALTLNARFRGRGVLRAAVLIPWAIPAVVPAKMWAWMLNDQIGVINDILMRIGLLSSPVA